MYRNLLRQFGRGGFQGGRVLGDQNKIAPIPRGLAGELEPYSAAAAVMRVNVGEGCVVTMISQYRYYRPVTPGPPRALP